KQGREEIGAVLARVDVVVRIDNRQFGFESCFFAQSQPVATNFDMADFVSAHLAASVSFWRIFQAVAGIAAAGAGIDLSRDRAGSKRSTSSPAEDAANRPCPSPPSGPAA